MDKSRFGPVDADVIFVKSADDLSQAEVGDIAIADLSKPDALKVLVGLNGPRRIAYSSHVEADAIADAKQQGIEVFPRSRFFPRIVEILAQADQ